MLFRYKVKPNKYPGCSNPTPYNHYVKIQMYNESAHVFHWKTIAKNELCRMVCELHPYLYDNEGISFATSLSEKTLYSMLTGYENMGHFIKTYIIDVLSKSLKNQKQIDRYEDQIFKFAVTDGWNCVEIKEEN